MDVSSKQWHPLGDAATPAEAAALLAVKEVLPDDAVTRAWTNLSFIDREGRTAEVDLLLLTKVGFFVVELKGWHGIIDGDQQNWRHSTPNGHVRHVRNPFFATDLKAKRLRGLLEDTTPNERARKQIPYVGAFVVLHGQDSTVRLPENATAGLVALDGYGVKGLPQTLSQFLATPPAHQRHLIDGPRATQIAAAVQRAGFTPTPPNRYVGQYSLEKADPLSEGPTWQDVLAKHPTTPSVRRRLRVFGLPPGSSAERQQELERAARREFVFTQGVQHPGIACPLELVVTDSGPALIFEYDDAEVPLDEYLAREGANLGIDERLGMIRQLADALRYAHHRRLVHRGLTPRQVYVNAAATPPRLVIRDWQTGRRTGTGTTTALLSTGSTTSARPGAAPPSATSFGTDDVRALIGHRDWVYLAPEAHHGGEDLPAIPLDVYGVGSLSYLILTGEPPAATLAELQQRLEDHQALDPQVAQAEVPDELAEVIRAATRRVESERTATIEEFLSGLDAAEDALTAPPQDAAPEERPRAQDPLTAGRGEIIGDRFVVKGRRGSGSTGVALHVDDYAQGTEGLILKLAKDDAASRRLEQEAEVLRQLDHPRVVRLLAGPLDVDGRTGLLLSDAGKQTLAGLLETKGKATLQELERFGSDLLEAVAHLDSRGIFHRDIKPANLGITPDPSTRKPRLVLFDLSLARESLDNVSAGTRGYVDPFIELSKTARATAKGAPGAPDAPRPRRRFDRAAELYAVAVTLFEMATTQLPWWHDGSMTPASLGDALAIDVGLFEPVVAEGLLSFFRTALAGDVAERFGDVTAMAQAWHRVFAAVDDDGPDGPDEAARDALADAAVLDTPLADAGLSPRALSALSRVQASTVGELVRTSPMVLNAVPGMGEEYRKEVQRRVRAWRSRLLLGDSTGGTTQDAAPLGGDRSLETSLSRLVPRLTQANAAEVATLRLLLGLPLDPPVTVGWWPTAAELAEPVGVTRARVSQILDAAAKRWRRSPVVRAATEEVLDALRGMAGVAALPELARQTLLRHGSVAEGPDRLLRAVGLVRAVVEADARASEPAFVVRRPRGGGAVLVAAASTVPDPAALTLPAEALLDDAQRLAEVVTGLLAEQAVVPAAAARTALRALRLRAADLSDERILDLAAAASGAAHLSSLHELYRPDLAAQQAAEIALRGVSVAALTEAGVRSRVANRFPMLDPLPERPALDAIVTAAVPGMRWEHTRYARPTSGRSSVASSVMTVTSTEPADVVDGHLRASLRRSSALTLCTHPRQYDRAVDVLTGLYGVHRVDVAAQLLAAVRSLAAADGVDWDVVLRADAEVSGPERANLLGLVQEAIAEPWRALVADPRPLLLTDLGPLARYELTGLLSDLLDQSRPRPAARWLLVARRGSTAVPTLDGRPVPLGPDRWIDLPADLSALRSNSSVSASGAHA